MLSVKEGDEKVLTPNMIMWGKDEHIVEDIEVEENQLTELYRGLNTARQHAWSRWQKEFVHSFMESHCISRDISCLPEVEKLCSSLEKKRTEVSGKRQRFYDLLNEKTML